MFNTLRRKIALRKNTKQLILTNKEFNVEYQKFELSKKQYWLIDEKNGINKQELQKASEKAKAEKEKIQAAMEITESTSEITANKIIKLEDELKESKALITQLTEKLNKKDT